MKQNNPEWKEIPNRTEMSTNYSKAVCTPLLLKSMFPWISTLIKNTNRYGLTIYYVRLKPISLTNLNLMFRMYHHRCLIISNRINLIVMHNVHILYFISNTSIHIQLRLMTQAFADPYRQYFWYINSNNEWRGNQSHQH